MEEPLQMFGGDCISGQTFLGYSLSSSSWFWNTFFHWDPVCFLSLFSQLCVFLIRGNCYLQTDWDNLKCKGKCLDEIQRHHLISISMYSSYFEIRHVAYMFVGILRKFIPRHPICRISILSYFQQFW